MKSHTLLVLLASLLILTACSSTREETEQALGDKFLKTALNYLSKEKMAREDRDEIAKLIRDSSNLLNPHEENDFNALGRYIVQNDKQSVIDVYNKLAPNYDLEPIDSNTDAETIEP